ncbi:MAG: 30S ribosomal protein S8 [Patescibacteria group bacterium]
MDIIANMFTKIKNAQAVGKETVVVDYSKLKKNILDVLLKNKFIKEVSHKGKKDKKIIEITLLYDEKGNGRISGIERISKLSRRIYTPFKKIKSLSRGRLLILSTPKGVLWGDEAIKEGVGGEIICRIW